MIEINLVPEGQKIKTNTTEESKFILYLIPVIFGLLLLAHIYLLGAFFVKSYQLGLLDKKWKALEPDRRVLENLSKQYNVVLQGDKVIQDLLIQRITWAEKLNKLSLNLPPGIWFNEIYFSGNNFTLNGSVISFQKQEMNLINNFLDSLKKDPGFSRDFIGLELGSIQRKTIATYEVIDFSVSGKLK